MGERNGLKSGLIRPVAGESGSKRPIILPRMTEWYRMAFCTSVKRCDALETGAIREAHHHGSEDFGGSRTRQGLEGLHGVLHGLHDAAPVGGLQRTDADPQQGEASRFRREGADVAGATKVRVRPHQIMPNPIGQHACVRICVRRCDLVERSEVDEGSRHPASADASSSGESSDRNRRLSRSGFPRPPSSTSGCQGRSRSRRRHALYSRDATAPTPHVTLQW